MVVVADKLGEIVVSSVLNSLCVLIPEDDPGYIILVRICGVRKLRHLVLPGVAQFAGGAVHDLGERDVGLVLAAIGGGSVDVASPLHHTVNERQIDVDVLCGLNSACVNLVAQTFS